MTGAVIDIATRRVVAPPVVPDREVIDTIYDKMSAVIEEHLPDLSQSSTARPHFERALRTMRRRLGGES